MLGQIESAFADRSRSEARLRRFLADASHELRTPLAAIRGYAELFRIGAASDPETLTRAMARIEAEATRMGILVEDLLLLAQLDQLPEPRRAPVDLGELAREAALDARVAAKEWVHPDGSPSDHAPRPIAVEAGEGPRAPLAAGDADRLRQVLANLLRNAIIHTPAGSPIEIEARRDGDRAVLAVRDHGPGLPPGDPEQLFERFWRQQGGRRRGPGGAGLGLAIVRAIVDAHGGTVTAATAPGGGAIFTVELPAAATAPDSRASQQTLSLLTPGS
jgi:two-component system OmpR family sensor kinase